MKKKTTIFLLVLLISGISSCSMWDDVDKNSLFEIPVGNINVVNSGSPNPAQWNDIPIFLKNDIAKNAVSPQAINYIKIATNTDRNILYFLVDVNSSIGTSQSYMIIMSNDYSCSGSRLNLYIAAPTSSSYKGDICSATFTLVSSSLNATSSLSSPKQFEASIDISQVGLNLNDVFLVSAYSHSNLSPYIPYSNVSGSTTTARWAKLR